MAGEGIGSICMGKKKYFADCFSLTNRYFRYLASALELDRLKEIPDYSSLHRHTSAEEHRSSQLSQIKLFLLKGVEERDSKTCRIRRKSGNGCN